MLKIIVGISEDDYEYIKKTHYTQNLSLLSKQSAEDIKGTMMLLRLVDSVKDSTVLNECNTENICDLCTNKACEFQSGIKRSSCAFYMPPNLEADNCGNYVVQANTECKAEDCISKIEVIDYLCKHCPDDGECFTDCDEIKHLRQMPSVTPQEPRKGHWIFDGDCLICSECKKAYSFSGSNFCPNCGADMRGIEE